jgi:hypothetical protein
VSLKFGCAIVVRRGGFVDVDTSANDEEKRGLDTTKSLFFQVSNWTDRGIPPEPFIPESNHHRNR